MKTKANQASQDAPIPVTTAARRGARTCIAGRSSQECSGEKPRAARKTTAPNVYTSGASLPLNKAPVAAGAHRRRAAQTRRRGVLQGRRCRAGWGRIRRRRFTWACGRKTVGGAARQRAPRQRNGTPPARTCWQPRAACDASFGAGGAGVPGERSHTGARVSGVQTAGRRVPHETHAPGCALQKASDSWRLQFAHA